MSDADFRFVMELLERANVLANDAYERGLALLAKEQ